MTNATRQMIEKSYENSQPYFDKMVEALKDGNEEMAEEYLSCVTEQMDSLMHGLLWLAKVDELEGKELMSELNRASHFKVVAEVTFEKTVGTY